MDSKRGKMLRASEECANLAAFIRFEVEEKQIESPDQYQTLINGLLYNRLAALKDFRKRKQTIIDEEAKREVLEKCASDIMFDYELLTFEEKEIFDRKYGEQVSEMMMQVSLLPPADVMNDETIGQEYKYTINYRLFNIEALCNLRLDLIDYIKTKEILQAS